MPPTKPSLVFPLSDREQLSHYLPSQTTNRQKPFVTLTFAQSIDSKIALAPGTQTALSGPETKALTHYLRSVHDAILIGAGTAVADDPALNCRLEGVSREGQPRPVILDPKMRWDVVRAQCTRLAYANVGKGPWVFSSTTKSVGDETGDYLKGCGGEHIRVAMQEGKEMDWHRILDELWRLGIKSVMVEGGASVINALLSEKYGDLVDVVIITIAPVWLGEGGLSVFPPHAKNLDGAPRPAARLKNVKWQQYGEDVVVCGSVERTY